jgi:hypothetical protein
MKELLAEEAAKNNRDMAEVRRGRAWGRAFRASSWALE